jgi:argininosuccinate lyase
MENKIWKGRIKENMDIAAEDFTFSIDLDKELYLYDITGTAAHAAGLLKIGVITEKELVEIFSGLEKVRQGLEKGKIDISSYEDIHSLVENELHKIIGDAAMKIHTGRSRNDQVVLDEKLFLKDALVNIMGNIITLENNILNKAKNTLDIIIPAYTHMQKAQPVLCSHYLMSYYHKFERDLESFFNNFELCDSLPLGAAACTGSGYNIDRNLLKELLKFENLDKNSMDTVGSRDYIIDFIFSCSKTMLHLSRFCEDLIIYNSGEFSFIEIEESYCSGSSIMPQKKNPDILELIRGKSALVTGNLIQLMMLLKGLPSTYNRDLQEDKKILFSAYKETVSSIKIFSKLIDKINFNESEIKNNLEKGFPEATDIADYLVKKGESFRKAHSTTGKIIRFCINEKIAFRDMALEELKKYSENFDNDVYEYADIRACVENKKADCGTGRKQVLSCIDNAEKKIKYFTKKLKTYTEKIPSMEEIKGYMKNL